MSQSSYVSRAASPLGKAGPIGCTSGAEGYQSLIGHAYLGIKSTVLVWGSARSAATSGHWCVRVPCFLWERDYPQEKEATVDRQYNYTKVSLPSSPGHAWPRVD